MMLRISKILLFALISGTKSVSAIDEYQYRLDSVEGPLTHCIVMSTRGERGEAEITYRHIDTPSYPFDLNRS